MKKSYPILGNVYYIENVADIYDDISQLNFNNNINEELASLDEDLFQLVFKNGITIDIGWYPSFNANGRFIIYVVENNDWVNPLLTLTSTWDKNELIKKLTVALQR